MKRVIAFGAAAIWSTAVSAGIQCERWEYAKLKDGSRAELTSYYCSSMSTAKLNGDLNAVKKDLFSKQIELGDTSSAELTRREMAANGGAQVGCLAAAEDATGMLSKKFGIKAPPSCR